LAKIDAQLLVCFLCALLVSCAAKTPESSPAPAPGNPADALAAFRSELDLIFDDPNFRDAFWGVKIQSLETGEVLYERNPTKLFMPASNQKIVIAAVALAWLGPEYRFKTSLHTVGPMEDGRLKGDLVVVGSGDPTISGRYHDGDPLLVFRQWAERLDQAGVRVIEGNIVGVDDAFDDKRLGPGWAWEDLSSGSKYTAEVSGLQFNDNLVDLVIQPGMEPGDAVEVRVDPPTDYVTIESHLSTVGGPGGFTLVRQLEGNRFRLEGTVKASPYGFNRTVAVFNPTRFTVQVLKDVLEDEGIEVSGEAIDADDSASSETRPGSSVLPDDSTLLLTHESPPLSEILRGFLKSSETLFGETLMKTLGRETYGTGSHESGRWVIQQMLTEFGIPADTYIVVDGSGMSSYNFISPDVLMRVLRNLYRHPEFQVFYDALPIAGVDGTIRERMKGSRAAGNVHAKTGTLANVRALSGYVTTADGEMVAFVMIANNFTAPKSAAEYVQDLVCERLAHLQRRSEP
jgi:D-alanyl-D-alanine carboxypeptidase/D-alanyl-D-alanine-endopeptidase (penicillin-binding protein 4)